MSKVLLQKFNKSSRTYDTVEELKNKTEAYKKLEQMKKNKEIRTSAGFFVETYDGDSYRFVQSKNNKPLSYLASEASL